MHQTRIYLFLYCYQKYSFMGTIFALRTVLVELQPLDIEDKYLIFIVIFKPPMSAAKKVILGTPPAVVDLGGFGLNLIIQ